MNSLHGVFIEKLKDLYDVESQLIKALPKMAEAATNSDLKAGFNEHLAQTEEHLSRLEEIGTSLGEDLTGTTSDVMTALIAEGEKIINRTGDTAVKDAALIAAAQKVEHYEIAAYGTVTAWAKAMEHDDAADLLGKTLDEEKDTDEKLSTLAEGGIIASGINEEAIEDEA
jgi:ferritin-like metal-binding protein YciE